VPALRGRGEPTQRIGRDNDVEAMRRFVYRALLDGSLMSGEAGVGLSVLPEVAADHASSQRAEVLRATWIAQPRRGSCARGDATVVEAGGAVLHVVVR
jgi:hypothetical protein